MSFWRNQPDSDTEPQSTEVDPFPVPAHLRPYYDKARGPDPRELARARAGVEGATPREIELRPPGTGPGPRDEYRRLRDVDLDQWTHETKLRQAEAAFEGGKRAASIKAMTGTCALCGRETWPAGSLATVTTLDGRDLRLCSGDCRDTVAAEINRRRWADHLTQLLDPDDPASTDAPVLG